MELEQYKKNRIAEISKIYYTTLAKLNTALNQNISNIQRQRITASNKTKLINNLRVQYNTQVTNLANQLNTNIQKIKAFIPTSIGQVKQKKALMFGLNYIGTPYQLNGCIDDCDRIKSKITTYGFNAMNINTFTDNSAQRPTKSVILQQLANILLNSVEGDLIFFYYSGHGSYIRDTNGDETDGKDECIVSVDLQYVVDDELNNIIKTNIKKDVTLFCLFDSCHSGTILDLRYQYSNISESLVENMKNDECLGNVVMISGCMDSQTSAEAYINGKTQGALTWAFIETLNKTQNPTWRQLLYSMRTLLKNNGYSQYPQLSTDSIFDIDSTIFI